MNYLLNCMIILALLCDILIISAMKAIRRRNHKASLRNFSKNKRQDFKSLNLLSLAVYENFMSKGKICDYLDDHVILENGPKNKKKAYRVVIGVRKGNHEDLFVVFRGTVAHSINNWITDLKIATDKIKKNPNCKGCEIHRGFRQTYFDILGPLVKTEINERLAKNSKIKNLIFTGHSLGGALATLGAYNYVTKKILGSEKLKNIDISLVAFGSPRVGNIKFAKYMNHSGLKYNVRVIFGHDLVSSLPTKKNKLLGGHEYLHTGTEIFCSGKNKAIKVGKLNEDTCSKFKLSALNPVSRILDHARYHKINIHDLVKKIKSTKTLPVKADFIKDPKLQFKRK